MPTWSGGQQQVTDRPSRSYLSAASRHSRPASRPAVMASSTTVSVIGDRPLLSVSGLLVMGSSTRWFGLRGGAGCPKPAPLLLQGRPGASLVGVVIHERHAAAQAGGPGRRGTAAPPLALLD